MKRAQVAGGFILRYVIIVIIFAVLLIGVLIGSVFSSSADQLNAERNIALVGERTFQSVLRHVDNTKEVGFLLTSQREVGHKQASSFLDTDFCKASIAEVPDTCAWRLRRKYFVAPRETYFDREDEWISDLVVMGNFKLGETIRRAFIPSYDADATPIEFEYEQGRLS